MANRHRDQRGREADLLGSDILTPLGSPGGLPGGDPGIREENPPPPTCTQARTLGGPRGGSGPAEPGTSTPGHPDTRTLPLLGVCAQESNRGRRGAWREPSGRGWQQKPGLWLTYQGLGADAVWSPVSCLRGRGAHPTLRRAAACVPLGPCPKGFGLTEGRHISAPGNLGRLSPSWEQSVLLGVLGAPWLKRVPPWGSASLSGPSPGGKWPLWLRVLEASARGLGAEQQAAHPSPAEGRSTPWAGPGLAGAHSLTWLSGWGTWPLL